MKHHRGSRLLETKPLLVLLTLEASVLVRAAVLFCNILPLPDMSGLFFVILFIGLACFSVLLFFFLLLERIVLEAGGKVYYPGCSRSKEKEGGRGRERWRWGEEEAAAEGDGGVWG